MSIELRQLRHALALHRHGNFAKAAEEVFLTQPSLSRSIAQLESELNVQLFDRTNRRVTATAFGQLLLEKGEALLTQAQQLLRDLDQLKGLELGELSIVAGPYAAETLVADTMARLIDRHPALRISLEVVPAHALQAAVIQGKADLGVASATALDSDEDLQTETLPGTRIFLACRPDHPLTQASGLTLARVSEFPMAASLMQGHHAAIAHAASGTTKPNSGHYRPEVLVHSPAIAKRMAQNSDLVVPLPATSLLDEVINGKLCVLNVQDMNVHNAYAVVFSRKRVQSPAAGAFVSLLKDPDAHAASLTAEACLAEFMARNTP